jgi:hypothetical protein
MLTALMMGAIYEADSMQSLSSHLVLLPIILVLI